MFDAFGKNLHALHARRIERSKGHNAVGAESLGTPEIPNNVASTFFNTVHFIKVALRFL